MEGEGWWGVGCHLPATDAGRGSREAAADGGETKETKKLRWLGGGRGGGTKEGAASVVGEGGGGISWRQDTDACQFG